MIFSVSQYVLYKNLLLDSMLVFIYGAEIRSFSWFKIWYATAATHFLFFNTYTLTSKELLEIVLLYNRREAIIVLN